MCDTFYLCIWCSMINQIFNEDCLEWMKRIPDWSIDCIITDPPYWSTKCSWDTVIPFDKMWEQLKRIIKPNWAIVLFWSEPFSSALRMSNIKMYKYDWKWEKTRCSNVMQAKISPLKNYEDILVFSDWTICATSKNKVLYNPQWLTDCKKECTYEKKNDWVLWNRKLRNYIRTKTGYPKSIIKFNNENGLHPTQKPVALIEYLIKTYTNEWETVLDFTMGSGTTAIACINTNRNYIGFELDKWYFDIANERIAWKLQNKK